MSTIDIRFPLAPIEVMHLAGLVDELTAVIADSDEALDPGLARLTPTPYPGDAESAAEFATATRDELLDRRAADAAVVRRTLEPFIAQDTSDEQSDNHLTVVIRHNEVNAWLRTLTTLRLVIATRLGITADDGDHDPDDPRYGVFDWLAFRLDGLIEIADALDDMPGGP